MAKYYVTAGSVQHNGTLYLPGDALDLTDDEARPIYKIGGISTVDPANGTAPHIETGTPTAAQVAAAAAQVK